MRIGIDARLLEPEIGLTGIATSLLETLRQLNNIDQVNEYYLFSRKPIHTDIHFGLNWHIVTKDFPQGMMWYNTVLIFFLKKYKIEAFWNLNHILPMIKPKGCKYIVTINDLAIFKIPGIGEKSNVIKQHLFVKASCQKADRVIAISKATKQDLIKVFGIPANKIKVNYLAGLNENIPFTEQDYEVVKNKYRIKDEFFLYIGTLEPRKNLITLTRAYQKICDDRGVENTPQLVIAGGKGWKFEETQKVIDECSSKKNILQVGYITTQEKNILLNKSKCFVFPSLYEGFGIPVIEAMSCGTIVVTSKNSSLPEVGGDAAVYINEADNIEDLKNKLVMIMNMDIAERYNWVKKSLTQKDKFTWEKTAQGFIGIVQEMFKI